MKKIVLFFSFAITLATSVCTNAQWNTNGTNVYYNGGNVGIGTNSPTNAFEIIKPNTSAKLAISSTGSVAGTITATLESKWNGAVNTGFFITTNNFPVVLNNIFRVTTQGVTIGAGSNYSLTVDGKIGARDIIVTNATPWPDYVFDNSYKLMSLSDLRSFIKKYNHLPEMPSAAEVEKEGQDLGKINMLLLKKVEELTLYMLEQDKRINELESRLTSK